MCGMFEPTDLQWVFGLRKVFLVQRLQLYKLLRGKDSYAVKIKDAKKSFKKTKDVKYLGSFF